MEFSNQNDRIKRYAVALQGAIRKTINVKLNDGAPSQVTALQVDNQKNVLNTKVLQPQEADANFDFDDDGELWFVEGTEIPALDHLSSLTFGDNYANMQLQIFENENSIGDRDIKVSATTKIPDEG